MSDPADGPAPANAQNPDALVEGNRVTTAEDMESSEKPGYEGEAPNLPLASQGSRDGTPADDEQ